VASSGRSSTQDSQTHQAAARDRGAASRESCVDGADGASHAATVDAAEVEELFGTYRVARAETPRDRRTGLWLAVVGVLLLGGWGAVRYRSGSTDGAVRVAVYAVMIVLVNVLVRLVVWWWGPRTLLDAAGVHVRTGLTDGRRSVAWEEVADVEVADRWTGGPALLLRDGGRLGLPGVPAAVAGRLLQARSGPRGGGAASSSAPPPRTPDDDGWEGPFRRGWTRGRPR
jgi:hypothetical protein